MQRIVSLIDTRTDEFRANDVHNRRLAAELKERQQAARFTRPKRDLERLRRQNKMFVRDRIEALLDPGTPFLELSTLAGNRAYENEVPGAAQVVGIGIVSGREVILPYGRPWAKRASGSSPGCGEWLINYSGIRIRRRCLSARPIN